jgi:TP901 family phage tail tape measure protein
MAAINLDIGGNTRQLERDIQRTVNRAYTINLKTKGEQPLGRITGQVNEFEKSLAASNARVIAFGASAGIIFGVQNAFVSLAKSVVDVQKSLQDINVILNVSTSQLSKFGANLFDIAKNTGQSFQQVADAATEFSRQGLGLEETLKRTNEALILSRLSGLDTVKSVEALTAAVNSFASQAVTATQIVNKFATVDAAFAVSSADLADALARVGSSAAQSGVSLDELIAIVTSAQQTTARGGAVIGNSLKTIFTRLQREKVVNLLESLGVETTGASGELKSTIDLLEDLAVVYDNLGTQQQAYVAEQVGGVFQINILKAALADLGKEYSIYNNALKISATATDQAVKRNEELNKTFAAQLNALQQNITQFGGSIGEGLLTPLFDRTVGNLNELLGGINESDANGFGATLGKGIVDGLGQVLAGPGLALIGGVLIKLFKDFSVYASGSLKDLLGLNTASKQQAELQRSINQIISKNPELYALMQKGASGLNQASQILLQNLKSQTLELQTQQKLSSTIAKQFYGAGVRISGGVPVAPTGRPGRAAGYIPNFAVDDFAREELLARTLGAKNPKAQMSKGTIDGKKFIKNNREVEITGFGNNGDSAVIPTYAKGFVPNFADRFNIKGSTFTTAQIPYAIRTGRISAEEARKAGYVSSAERQTISTQQKRSKKVQNLDFLDYIYLYAGPGAERTFRSQLKDGNTGNLINFGFTTAGLRQPLNFKDEVNNIMGDAITKIAGQIYPSSKPFDGPSGLLPYIDKSATNQFLGRIFEASVNRAIGKDVSAETGTGTLDIPPGAFAQNSKEFKEIFNIGKNYQAGDFKFSAPRAFSRKSSELSFASKISRTAGLNINPVPLTSATGRQNRASGYIPNFAAIQDAISRERAAGIPSSQIYLAQEKALTSANPMGIGVFNKQDEPTKRSRKNAVRRKGFASGYIPNFAVGANDTEPANLAASIAAIGTQLGGLALVLSLNRDSINSSLTEMIGSQKLASGMTVADAKVRQQAIKEEITASQGNVQKIRKLQGEYDKLSTQISATRNRGDITTATRGQKVGAAISANTLGITFIAPIIAETVANAIGQGSKEARAGSAAASGLGNIASFAATGALIAGPWGAAIGGAIGGVTTLTSIIKEASTDIPELTAAADKSSQALTRLNEASGTISNTFTNLQQLRESGKTKEAATLESSLINDIQKTFKDNPALAGQAISAIKSNDFKMLSEALGKNTEAVIKKTLEDQKNLATGTFREDVGGLRSSRFTGGRGNYGFSKQETDKFRESFQKNILDVSDIGTGQVQGQKLQDLDKEINKIVGNAQANPEVLSQIFSKIGVDFEKTGIQGNEEIRLAFNALRDEINRRAQIERNSADDSEETNKRLRAINQALNRAYSHYQQLAKNAANSAKFEFDLANQRRELSVEFGKTVLEGRSSVAETLGVSSAGQRGIANQQKTLEIDETFNKTVDDSLGQVNATFADLKSQLIESRISEIQKGTNIEAKTALSKAETRAAQIQTIGPEFEFFGKNIENAVGILEGTINEGLSTGSFDLSAFEQAISAGIETEDPEVVKKLEEVKASADETVKLAIKAEQTRKAQLAILAQQNINQLAQEFAKATVAAFGGFEKEFLGKDIGDKSLATEISDVAIKRQNYVDALGRAESSGPMTEQQRQELGRLSGNVYSAIESIVGRPLGLDENTPLRQQEIQGRASQITGQFQQIRTEAGGNPEVLQAINEAERKLAEQTGFIDDYNKIISTAQNPATTEEQANIEAAGGAEQWARAALDELFQKVALKTATVQSNELRKTGDLETTFFDAAAKTLDPAQQAALKEAGAAGQELFKDPAVIMSQQLVKTDETNTILGQIRDEISQALLTPNTSAANPAFNFGSNPGQVPLPTFNTTVSPTVNINMNGGAGGTQVNAEGMSAETAKVLEENKDRILAAGGLTEKVASLENAVYNRFPNDRPPPGPRPPAQGGAGRGADGGFLL